MKAICFYFEVHLSEQLRRYHFFDIGRQHDYFDYYLNRTEIEQLAKDCFLPANETLKKLIDKYKGKFKVAFLSQGVLLSFLSYTFLK